MKSGIKIFMLIIAMSITQISLSQQGYLLDSVEIDLGNNKSIELITENFHTFNQKGKLNSIYKMFVEDLSKVESELISSNNSNTMEYDFDAKYRGIRINSDKVVSAEVFVDNDGNIIYFQRVGFQLGEKDKLTVKAGSIDDLKAIALLDIDALIEQADEKISPKGKRTKKHKSAKLIYKNNEISDTLSRINSSAKDIIEMGLGFGMGTVRSTLTPDIEGSILIGLSKKGRLRHHFGVSGQWLYSFTLNDEGKNKFQRDGFFNLVYSISSQSAQNKTVNKGITIGRLMRTETNNFRDNTYKVGLFRSLGSGISLEGGFFAEDGFSTAFPYARLYWNW